MRNVSLGHKLFALAILMNKKKEILKTLFELSSNWRSSIINEIQERVQVDGSRLIDKGRWLEEPFA